MAAGQRSLAAWDGTGVVRPAAGRVDDLKRAAGWRAAWLRRDSAILPRPTRRAGPSPEAPLEPGAGEAYCRRMAETSPGTPAPAGWHESLSRSKAQIAAGESVPLLPVLDRLRASAERLEAEQGITADGAEAPADR